MSSRLLYTASARCDVARRPGAFVATVDAALPEGWAPFPGDEPRELAARLTACVEPLSDTRRNRVIAESDEEELARWICDQLRVPGVERVGLRTASEQGAVLAAGAAILWGRYAFEAAHRLPHVPPDHKCGRMHGHGFRVVLHAEQAPAGTRVSRADLDRCWAPLHDTLHHRCLNDVPGLENPTSEVIAAWIHERARRTLPAVTAVTVQETASTGAHFDGAAWQIWKEMTLDSAVQLRHAPEGDRRRGVFGHTYTLRLDLAGPLDPRLGWVVDYGDVKAAFAPVFDRLDHQPLMELPGLPDGDVASLVRWIRREAAPRLPALVGIHLLESSGAGALLTWASGAALPPVVP